MGCLPGPLAAFAARLVPGIARVEREIAPYAQAWRAANWSRWTFGSPRIVSGESMSLGIGANRFDTGWVAQLMISWRRTASITRSWTCQVWRRVSDVTDQQLLAWRTLRSAKPMTDAWIW